MMDVPFELQIALRYLLAKRKQAFISVISLISTLGVVVGVMALVHPENNVLKVERVDGETYVTLDRMISMVSNIYTPEALRRIA